MALQLLGVSRGFATKRSTLGERDRVMNKISLTTRRRNVLGHPFGLLLALLGLISVATLVLSPFVLAQTNPGWNPTGRLNTPRYFHTTTLLPNGKVLVVGGSSGATATSSAELYDPATGAWSVTGSLNIARFLDTAILLQNGKVLVVADASDATGISSAELYDPATGAWSVTGSLNIARSSYTATLLENGKVLVAGGWNTDSAVASAELYDPATGTWSVTGGLLQPRYRQTATLLQNGKVLVAGGSDDGDGVTNLASAELYDPATGTWSSTGNLNVSRILHTATLLPNGNVLVAGGYSHNMVLVDIGLHAASPTSLNGAELYDPATGTWSVTDRLKKARDFHTATLLPDGKVLVAAGEQWTLSDPPCGLTASCLSFHNHLNDAELYDSATGTWSVTAALRASRSRHAATLLLDGLVLVTGGENDTGTLDSAELYDATSVPGTLAVDVLLAEAEVGVPYSGDLQIGGGQSPYVISIVNGSLPPGLSLASSSIVGTPTLAGNKQFTIQVLDQFGAVVTRSLRVKVLKGVAVSNRNLRAGKIGKKFNASLKANGGKKPFTWSLVSGTLPAGLALDTATGTVSGTPAVASVSDLTFRVTDSLGGSFQLTITLTIN